VREYNEDACIELPGTGIWAVADGMGGHDDGAYASKLVVEALAQIGSHTRLSDLVNDVEDKLCEVHAKLVNKAEVDKIVGSTVATMLIKQQYSVFLWVGDSRVYRFRDNKLEQITQDHSYVEELIAQGSLSRNEAERHPDANVITRAVGAGEELYLDARLEEVRCSDIFLICSDGLYKEVCNEEISEVMRTANCQQICDELLELVLERGAQDNVTVLSVAIEDVAKERIE
jgi:serine/threonine protein phosphatase PrpC